MARNAPEGPPAPHPNLIVIGAAGEMARLFATEVFARVGWQTIWLLDKNPAIRDVVLPVGPETVVRRALVDGTRAVEVFLEPSPDAAGDAPGTSPAAAGDAIDGDDGGPAVVDLSGLDAAVCVAVPHADIERATGWLLPTLAPTSTVFDLSSEKSRAMAALTAVAPELAVFGTHPLFGHAVGTVEGQTVVVCPAERDAESHRWFEAALQAAGAVSKEMTAERHDLVMAYVQTAVHQALLAFADVVTGSGLDLDDELWACRTPPFETLMALVSRILTPTQVTTVASIQLSTSGARIADELADAVARNQAVIGSGELTEIEDRMKALGASIPGSLFNRMQQAGNLAIRAIQSPRSILSEQRRSGNLVGISPKGRPERLRIGRVTDLTSTTVTLENLLVGKKGEAALLGPYRSAAKRMGVGGHPSVVEFGLGNVDLFIGPDLEAVTEEWLGNVTSDIRLLGPESVSVAAIAKLIGDEPLVRGTELVYEAVRAGQREFVIRCSARADSDVDGLAGMLQARIDDRYAWPKGVMSPSMHVSGTADPLEIAYLGPEGTFSTSAAAAAAELLADDVGALVPIVDFPTMLEGVGAKRHDLAILPICNSASGVVERALEAVIGGPSGLVAIGMVDIHIRLDAYVRAGEALSLGGIVVSQQQALSQTKRFIASYQLTTQECPSTVEALQQLADGTADVALAPPGMGERYGLRTMAPNVGDQPGAITRFLVIARTEWFESRLADGPKASDRDVSTARSLWVVAPGSEIRASSGNARFDEVLVASGGLELWVSTDPERFAPSPTIRALGTIPWSPRTPVVDL